MIFYRFGIFVFKSYGLSYTVLYLFDVAMYKVNDAVVVLGIFVLQATTLHHFERVQIDLYRFYSLAIYSCR